MDAARGQRRDGCCRQPAVGHLRTGRSGGGVGHGRGQAAWLAASLLPLHPAPACSTCADDAADSADSLFATRAAAFGTATISLVLALSVLGCDSLVIRYALVASCMAGTVATAAYAASLKQSTTVAKLGYGAALLSLAAGVTTLATALAPPPPPPMMPPPPPPLPFGVWNFPPTTDASTPDDDLLVRRSCDY